MLSIILNYQILMF